MKTSPKIDDYITRSATFAQPILKHLRSLVHRAGPGVEEKMKWSFPHFDYKGMMCSMAAFKGHCAFTFWKGDLLQDPENFLDKSRSDSMGQLGRITSLSDLPPDDVMTGFIKEAMRLNDENIKLPAKPKTKAKKELEIPDWFMAALKKNSRALASFEGFNYSHRKEYLEWVTEAKREETRDKRMQQTIEWLAEGKSRNWQYE